MWEAALDMEDDVEADDPGAEDFLLPPGLALARSHLRRAINSRVNTSGRIPPRPVHREEASESLMRLDMTEPSRENYMNFNPVGAGVRAQQTEEELAAASQKRIETARKVLWASIKKKLGRQKENPPVRGGKVVSAKRLNRASGSRARGKFRAGMHRVKLREQANARREKAEGRRSEEAELQDSWKRHRKESSQPDLPPIPQYPRSKRSAAASRRR